MFIVRPYKKSDLEGCTQCYIEGFFDVSLSKNDYKYLRDYTQCSIEMSNFCFVAEFEGDIAGFVCGMYKDSFDKKLADIKVNRCNKFIFMKVLFKSLFSDYFLSNKFRNYLRKIELRANERSKLKTLDQCDCELALISSKKKYRKGVGTALTNALVDQCRNTGVATIHVFTNTTVSYKFYEHYGMQCIEKVPYSFESEGESLVYEYKVE